MARIRIDVDDSDAVAGLRRLVRRVTDPRPAFDEIGSYLVASTIRRFETESGPGDRPWKKSGRAAREGGQTLTDKGRLRASITHNVLANGVEVGTNVIYAAIHQFGGRTKPRTIRPRRKKALYFPGARHPVRSVNHPGSNIPARPFLGVDERDRAAIARIVARHLELAP